jgi:hypothetical protein
VPPLNLYARVRFLLPIARETAGAARIRHSLLPLFGENQGQGSGRSCREIAEPYFIGSGSPRTKAVEPHPEEPAQRASRRMKATVVPDGSRRPLRGLLTMRELRLVKRC